MGQGAPFMTGANGFEPLPLTLWVKNLADFPRRFRRRVRPPALMTAIYWGRASSEWGAESSSCSIRAINSAGWTGLVR